MNPYFFLKAFAWISITGLCCMIFLDYWIPILLGTILLTLVVLVATPRRN